MKIRDFKLECYFGIYEFTAPYLLTQSDCESMTTQELLDMEPGAKEEYLQQWLGYSETCLLYTSCQVTENTEKTPALSVASLPSTAFR